MPRFDTSMFKDHGKIAVNCRTKEDTQAFLELCEKHGHRWNMGERATEYIPTQYGEELCIFLDTDRTLTYENIAYAVQMSYPMFLFDSGRVSELAPKAKFDEVTTILFELQR